MDSHCCFCRTEKNNKTHIDNMRREDNVCCSTSTVPPIPYDGVNKNPKKRKVCTNDLAAICSDPTLLCIATHLEIKDAMHLASTCTVLHRKRQLWRSNRVWHCFVLRDFGLHRYFPADFSKLYSSTVDYRRYYEQIHSNMVLHRKQFDEATQHIMNLMVWPLMNKGWEEKWDVEAVVPDIRVTSECDEDSHLDIYVRMDDDDHKRPINLNMSVMNLQFYPTPTEEVSEEDRIVVVAPATAEEGAEDDQTTFMQPFDPRQYVWKRMPMPGGGHRSLAFISLPSVFPSLSATSTRTAAAVAAAEPPTSSLSPLNLEQKAQLQELETYLHTTLLGWVDGLPMGRTTLEAWTDGTRRTRRYLFAHFNGCDPSQSYFPKTG